MTRLYHRGRQIRKAGLLEKLASCMVGAALSAAADGMILDDAHDFRGFYLQSKLLQSVIPNR